MRKATRWTVPRHIAEHFGCENEEDACALVEGVHGPPPAYADVRAYAVWFVEWEWDEEDEQ